MIEVLYALTVLALLGIVWLQLRLLERALVIKAADPVQAAQAVAVLGGQKVEEPEPEVRQRPIGMKLGDTNEILPLTPGTTSLLDMMPEDSLIYEESDDAPHDD